jgi:transcriptional regulator with XRE-family HTH domain
MKVFMSVNPFSESLQKKMKNPPEKTISQRIQKLRALLFWSQGEFGKMIGRTGRNIADWESGSTEPTEPILQHIENILNVYPSWLREGKGEIFMKGSDTWRRSQIVERITTIEKARNKSLGRKKKREMIKFLTDNIKAGHIQLNNLDTTITGLMKIAS